ncbi:MAG: germination protein YpeB [Clostridia bacterium]
MKGKKVLLVLMIVFAVTTVGLSIWLGLSTKNNKESQAMLENHYQQAYFVLLDETNDMEIKLAKILVTTSHTTRQELLYEVWKGAEISANSLSALSSRDATVTNTMRFINQVGDFSMYLANRVTDEKNLSAEHRDSLEKIHKMLKDLGSELGKIKDEITNGYLFVENINTDKDILTNVLGSLNEASVEYPQLIYDGPFSDALQDKKVLGLIGEDINEEKGIKIINSIYGPAVAVENLKFLGEWDSDIDTLNFEGKINGRMTTIQLAKKGGMLISINSYRDVTDPKLSNDECSEIAKRFLKDNGFGDMKNVWICNDNSTVFVNFAPLINNVVIYPDIIKLKIASDNGDILGLEARSYAFNHTTRELSKPLITAETARAKIKIDGEITAGRLALIPFKSNTEILTYEFVATSNGTYYIYIDAKTGEEVNILYVISSTNGDLLV